ncbi:MAG: 3-dehydroquinate synthase [Litorimonas sp.]
MTSNTQNSQTLSVDLGNRSYDIHIGEGLLPKLGTLIAPVMTHKRLAIITDENVYAHHGATIKAALKDYELSLIIRPAGEAQKSMAVLGEVLDDLFEAKFDRTDMILAFGGGVIGDLAGFAASIYKRGMPFIQIPTTLLAQVDSSVGGKTAINTRFGKNLIGAFYQPKMVIADTDILSTLPPREIKAGYAEVVKYGFLGNAEFFEKLDAGLGADILALKPAALTQAIATSCQTKAQIVAADERETGQRALLNLGHTFGHALELEAGYGGDLLHGEAVSAGMDMAFQYSAHMGLCSAKHARRAREHLMKLAMPIAADMKRLLGKPEALLAHMRQDKKNTNGLITLILSRSIGESFVQKDTPESDILVFCLSALEIAGSKAAIAPWL